MKDIVYHIKFEKKSLYASVPNSKTMIFFRHNKPINNLFKKSRFVPEKKRTDRKQATAFILLYIF